MVHFLVVVEAVLVSVLGGAVLFRGRRWWRYRVLVPAVLALVIVELAPLLLDSASQAAEIGVAGLLLAQGTVLWVMLRKEQAVHALLLSRIKYMLQDRVRNQLQVIAGAAHPNADTYRAMEEIGHVIDELSDLALAEWESGSLVLVRHPQVV